MRRCKYPFNIPVTNHQVTKSHKNLERAQKGTSIGLRVSWMNELQEHLKVHPRNQKLSKRTPRHTQISYTGNVNNSHIIM